MRVSNSISNPASLYLLFYTLQATASPFALNTDHSKDAPFRIGARNDPKAKFGTVLGTALGTFGPHGLLGNIDANGNVTTGDSDKVGAEGSWNANSGCVGRGCAAAAVAQLGGIGFDAYPQTMSNKYRFHNADTYLWPTYSDSDPLWAVRTFRDMSCGNYGQDPNGKDDHGPYMMAEYKAPDIKALDNQPCMNMMNKNSKDIGGTFVKSTAVWLSPTVQDGYIFVYSNPVCKAPVTVGGDGKPTTLPLAYRGSPDWARIYNGQAQVYGAINQKVEPSGPQAGKWMCLPGTANAFSVAAIGKTDMTVPDGFYQNGGIPPAKTLPKNMDAVKKSFKNPDWFTDDISKVNVVIYPDHKGPTTNTRG